MIPNQLASPAVVAALLAQARADATLAALLSTSPVDGTPAVYEEVAPAAAAYEFLVVGGPSEVPANTLGRGFGAAVSVILRAVSRTPANARAIISRAIALFDAPETPLVVAGYGNGASELADAGPGFTEEIRGEVVHHYPATIRVTVKLQRGSP